MKARGRERDVLVGQFREMYQDRPKNISANWLHGLAMIGVRAVLGVDSDLGSPFNIQRSWASFKTAQK
jgi:hypothetical protein